MVREKGGRLKVADLTDAALSDEEVSSTLRVADTRGHCQDPLRIEDIRAR